MTRTVGLVMAALGLALGPGAVAGGCGGGGDDTPGDAELPTYRVVIGGDVTLGRRFNEVLYDGASKDRVFAGVLPLLRDADVAVVNGEGVIAGGGRFTDKLEPRPYMYRAHPNAAGVLAQAGIDVVTAGNNHSGDYGREALGEMVDRLTAAGIDVIGGGHDARDARHIAYRRLGDMVLAVVGADLTYTEMFEATPSEPGSLYFNAYKTDEFEDRVVEGLVRQLEEARKHANVVLFTPHWGDCWIDEPAGEQRSLAARLLRAGYDGIVGHSAHWFQGVELIDGKPVVHDAGNLIVDFGGGDRAHEAFLWELEINRRGVRRVKGHPLWLKKNEAHPAQGGKREEMLEKLTALSDDLGTAVRVEGGLAVVDCSTGPMAGPGEPPDRLPARPRPARIREAPSDTIIDALPAGATPLDVAYPDGIRLVGYELLVDRLSVPKAGQFVILYWKADQPAGGSYKVHVEARGRDKKGKPASNSAPHFPGDWLLPVGEWPAGKIIRDWTLLRLTLHPEGEVRFFAGLAGAKGLIEPLSSDRPLEAGGLVPLGTARFEAGAKWMFDTLHEYRKARGIPTSIPRRRQKRASEEG